MGDHRKIKGNSKFIQKKYGVSICPPKIGISLKILIKKRSPGKYGPKIRGCQNSDPKMGLSIFCPKNGISSKILIKKRSPGKFRPIIGGLPKCRQKRV